MKSVQYLYFLILKTLLNQAVEAEGWRNENICNDPDFILTEVHGEGPLAGLLPAIQGSLGVGGVTVPAAQAFTAVLVC